MLGAGGRDTAEGGQMPRRATYGRTVGLVAVLLLALTPRMAAAAGWLPSKPASLSTDINPSVAMDGVGNTVLAWQNSSTNRPIAIQGARHVNDAIGFAALSDFSTGSITDSETPLVVSNRAGNGLVIWVHTTTPGNHEINVASVKSDGTVTKAVETISSGGGSDDGLSADIDENGDAVIAWRNGSNTIQASTRLGLGGSFSVEKNLGAATEVPSAAIDGAGNAIVVWQNFNGANQVIDGDRHPAGNGAWAAGEVSINTNGHDYTAPVVAANPNRQMVVAFNDSVGPKIDAVSGTTSGGWGPTPTVTALSAALGSPPHGPAATMLDNGGAAVGWSTSNAVQVSLRPPPPAPFPAPASVSSIPTDTPDGFTLGGNGAGELIAAWYLFDTGSMTNVVRASVKPGGSATFGASQIISDSRVFSGLPVLTVDQAGDAAAAFPLTNAPVGIGTAFYDNTPPIVGAITGPATVKTGVSASFSIPQPTDAFSTVRTISWSFGDGSAAATGLQVSHTFSKTGNFTVNVTATDAARNAANVTLPISVTQGASIPPPPSGVKCRVPKLKGKTLSQASTLLRRANCKLGKVTKPKARKHQKLRKLIVGRSSPGAGSVKAAGTKVSLTLVQVPKPKPKHKKHK